MTATITSPEPKKPDKLSRYAETCLLAIDHLLREWHDLPRMPYLGEPLPHIINDPNLHFV